MKKKLAILLGAVMLMVQGTSAFAEFSVEEIMEMATEGNTFEKVSQFTSLTERDENGRYLFYAPYQSGAKTFEEMPREYIEMPELLNKREIVVYSKDELEKYDGSGLFNYFEENNKEDDGREGHVEAFLSYQDNVWQSWNIFRSRTDTATQDMEYYFLTIPVDETNRKVESLIGAIEAFNTTEATELYDAEYLSFDICVAYENGTESLQGTNALYFDTNVGEIIIPTSTNNRLGIEEFSVYTVDELLEVMKGYFGKTITKTYQTTVDDEDVYVTETYVPVGEDEETTEPEQSSQATKEQEENSNDEPKQKEEELADEAKEPDEDKTDEEKSADVPVEEVPEDEFVKTDMNKIDVILNGKPLEFVDQEPVIVNDRVLVPLRVIFEELGADVSWNGEKQEVTMKKDGVTVSLIIGAAELIKNGEKAELDAAAEIRNKRTLVPIRAITESFGNTVTWDGNNKIVEIK